MTIEEAIQILTLDKTCDFEGFANDLEDALQLGIEALKAVKKIRSVGYWSANGALPGETEE